MKRRPSKRRRVIRGTLPRRRDDEIYVWDVFSVREIATNEAVRYVVKKSAAVPFQVQRRRVPFKPPVRATVEIDSYLTDAVPERLRRRTITMRREGDALVAAADMYLRVYKEDERRGGESALPNRGDINRRLKRRRKATNRFAVLRNRGFGPYIWGHDIDDLVFEGMLIKWTGPNTCNVRFMIGS